MAIKETTRKIHFLPYVVTRGRDEDTSAAPTASLDVKRGIIRFSKGLIRETGMDGKWVRMYYDATKKIIGWQLRDKIEQGQMKSWKLCRPNGKTGGWALMIKKMLAKIPGGMPTENMLGLPVSRYREQSALDSHHGEVFYYIELVERSDDRRHRSKNNPDLDA